MTGIKRFFQWISVYLYLVPGALLSTYTHHSSIACCTGRPLDSIWDFPGPAFLFRDHICLLNQKYNESNIFIWLFKVGNYFPSLFQKIPLLCSSSLCCYDERTKEIRWNDECFCLILLKNSLKFICYYIFERAVRKFSWFS